MNTEAILQSWVDMTDAYARIEAFEVITADLMKEYNGTEDATLREVLERAQDELSEALRDAEKAVLELEQAEEVYGYRAVHEFITERSA